MLISVVDDDPVFQFLCKAYFTHCAEDVTVVNFNNGELAWLHFKKLLHCPEEIPKLILVDINMPNMNGWDLVDEMAKFDLLKNTHVYMVSSSISASDREKSLAKPLVKDYLKKPLSITDFQRIYQQAFAT